LEPYLPGREGSWGGIAHDNRRFINAVFWTLRTGAPWRDWPPDDGDWKNTHRRFCRWRDKGIWEALLEQLVDEPDFEWLMIDASHVKVHPHASGAKGGNQDRSHTKGGLNTKLHLAVEAHGMPVRVVVTQGTTADGTQAARLLEGLSAEYLLADRGYDSDALLDQARKQGMTPVIPPKKNRKVQREYDKELYQLRHRIENVFLHRKRWRGIATRDAQNTASFLAAAHIRCLVLWLNIS
jgi:transposase